MAPGFYFTKGSRNPKSYVFKNNKMGFDFNFDFKNKSATITGSELFINQAFLNLKFLSRLSYPLNKSAKDNRYFHSTSEIEKIFEKHPEVYDKKKKKIFAVPAGLRRKQCEGLVKFYDIIATKKRITFKFEIFSNLNRSTNSDNYMMLAMLNLIFDF